jgi:hypothetical protein
MDSCHRYVLTDTYRFLIEVAKSIHILDCWRTQPDAVLHRVNSTKVAALAADLRLVPNACFALGSAIKRMASSWGSLLLVM